jgi:hypothetical protein
MGESQMHHEVRKTPRLRAGNRRAAWTLFMLAAFVAMEPAALAQPGDIIPPTCDITEFTDDGSTQSFSAIAQDDFGVCDIYFYDFAQNLSLDVPPFSCGDTPVNFTVDVDVPSAPARGNVTILDAEYNSAFCRIDLPVQGNATQSPAGWGEGVAIQRVFDGKVDNVYAHVASGEAGWFVYNVNDPLNPVLLDPPDDQITPSGCPEVSGYPDYYADGITIVPGGTAFGSYQPEFLDNDLAIVALGACGVGFFDISDPENIEQLFIIDTPSWAEAVDWYFHPGDQLFYVYAVSYWGGLRVFGQTDPGPTGNPDLFDEIASWGANDLDIGPAIDLGVKGDPGEFRDGGSGAGFVGGIRAFVLTDMGIRTVDVTDPLSSIFEVTDVRIDFDPMNDESGEGMTSHNNRIFVALWQGGLKEYDTTNVFDPDEPEILLIDEIPASPGSAFYAVETDRSGQRLYIAEGNQGLRTYWIVPENTNLGIEPSLNQLSPSPLDVANGGWAWGIAESQYYTDDRIVYVSYGVDPFADPLRGGFQAFEFAPDMDYGQRCGAGYGQASVVPVFLYWRVRRKRRKRD